MSGNKPLVSVIIPAHNHEKFVQETIKSIIAQTYKDIELLVIDDGSKDSTWEKIQELKPECEKRFVRVYFETKENEGTCKTLNKLVEQTKGKYIFLTASDDLAKPELIEKEVKFLSKNEDYSLVVYDNEFIDSEGKICYWNEEKDIIYDIKKAKYRSLGECISKRQKFDMESEIFGSYTKLRGVNHVPNGYLIRKSIFDKIGLFTPEAPLEDYWLMLQISKYSKMKYFNKIMFSYRWHGDNSAAKTDYLDKITEQTRQYERDFLKQKSINLKNMLPNAVNRIRKGKQHNAFGIPYIFEIKNYKSKRYKYKTREIYLFNRKILSSQKPVKK